MKNIVVFDEYNEVDFKPADLLNQYIKITSSDVEELLIKDKELNLVVCPACLTKGSKPAFERFGLSYVECNSCKSLYVSKRPREEDINYYYNNSKARNFWQNELSKVTNKKRKEKLITPRFEWIIEATQEYLPKATSYADVNTTQYGYIEEMLKTERFRQKMLINPFLKFDNIRIDQTIKIVSQKDLDDSFKDKIDVISLFEVTDRTSDLKPLFDNVHKLLREKGLCFITTTLISGFDLQVLWDRAENIYPPDRLNVLSVDGWRTLIERQGFECLEFSTPGILDVEIVRKAFDQKPDREIPRFIKSLLNNKNQQIRRDFQEFLQANLLSSYGRILIRKNKGI